MDSQIDFSMGKRCLRLNSFSPLFILLTIILNSCTSTPEPYSILEFTGNGAICNYSRSIYPSLYVSDSIGSTALLAGEGDIIAYGENSCFSYKVPSRGKFLIKNSNGKNFINDKINSLAIPANDDLIPWFKQIHKTDISELGFLFFDSVIHESYIPYLKDLAINKPQIGLGYAGNIKDMTRLFDIFKPEFIVGAGVSQANYKILSGLTSLRFLLVSLNDSVYTTPLPAMPQLKQLVITCDDVNAIKTDDFLINNRQIERLTIMGPGKFDLSLIKPIKSLKELVISGTDNILNFDMITDHKQLELLSVDGLKSSIDTALKKLPGIRWITFYEETTQAEFDSFIEAHADLEVLEINDNCNIKNLQPLLKLHGLYGLAISDTLTDFTAVKSLKSLKYLSLPFELLEDSIVNADIQKSLPGTIIVPNQGVCLGSGWLLLIIPLIVVLGIFTHKLSHRTETRL
jgi:hypothetical protein